MNADQRKRRNILAVLKSLGTPEATHAAVCITTCEPGDPRINAALARALEVDA